MIRNLCWLWVDYHSNILEDCYWFSLIHIKVKRIVKNEVLDETFTVTWMNFEHCIFVTQYHFDMLRIGWFWAKIMFISIIHVWIDCLLICNKKLILRPAFVFHSCLNVKIAIYRVQFIHESMKWWFKIETEKKMMVD